LDPQLEKQETDAWTRERITFNGADGERAIGYLYLPRNFPRPLQVIHYVPPLDVEMGQRPATQSAESFLGTEIKSGRAVFVVVLKGYTERLRPLGFVEPDQTTAEYRDKIVNWMTDLRRGWIILKQETISIRRRLPSLVRVLARKEDLFLLQLIDGTHLSFSQQRESENPTLSGLRKPT
jgi:hypothetical protein